MHVRVFGALWNMNLAAGLIYEAAEFNLRRVGCGRGFSRETWEPESGLTEGGGATAFILTKHLK